MKIDSRTSAQGGERTLYTGLANMNVIAINPSKNEMIALGMNPQTDPEYIGVTSDGNAKVTIDFYLREPETGLTTKKRFWLENKERVSSTGKNEYIDDYAQTGYANSPSELPTWVDSSTARRALSGEGQLLSFVAAFASVDPFPGADGKKGSCKFEDIGKLFSNDTSELRSLLTDEKTANNKVKVLLSVITTDEGKQYQDVYGGYFDRERSKSTKMWEKRLANDYTQCKGDYQNSLDFKPYTPTAVTTGTTGVTPDPVTTGAGSDDLPW